MKGKLIVFEGIDRSGKSKQAAMLENYYKSKDLQVLKLAFPNRSTSTGILIDSVLRGETKMCAEALVVLFTANRWESAQIIRQALAQGKIVILDRYIHSGLVYAAATGVDPKLACPDGLPVPDYIIYMDINPVVARDRSNYGEEFFEKLELQQRVYYNYNILRSDSWISIDASAGSAEVIHQKILLKIE
jgi:dTMP kinase